MDEDVKFLETRAPSTVQETLINKCFTNPNLKTDPPSILATPPHSPMDMSQHHPINQMPILTSLLSKNNSAYHNTDLVQIPCVLCKRPFSNIDQLRIHLTMHASLWKKLLGRIPNTQGTLPSPPASDSSVVSLPTESRTDEKVTEQIKSRIPLSGHDMRLPVNEKLEFTLQRRYQAIRKNYQLKHSLSKHMHSGHNTELAAAAAPASPASLVNQPQMERKEEKSEPRKVMVLSTRLLNGIAAAKYDPSKESAVKYLPPLPDSGKLQRKQRYPPRSPYFNPNLWINSDYVL